MLILNAERSGTSDLFESETGSRKFGFLVVSLRGRELVKLKVGEPVQKGTQQKVGFQWTRETESWGTSGLRKQSLRASRLGYQ